MVRKEIQNPGVSNIMSALIKWLTKLGKEWNFRWDFRSKYVRQLERDYDTLKHKNDMLEYHIERHRNEIEKLQITIREYAQKGYELAWTKDSEKQRYVLTVYLAAEELSLRFDEMDRRRYFAESVADNIRHQILSLKFIEDARIAERNRIWKEAADGPSFRRS